MYVRKDNTGKVMYVGSVGFMPFIWTYNSVVKDYVTIFHVWPTRLPALLPIHSCGWWKLVPLYFTRKVREQRSQGFRSFEFGSVAERPWFLDNTELNCLSFVKWYAREVKGKALEDVQFRLKSVLRNIDWCFL